jgi:hypothetical protein
MAESGVDERNFEALRRIRAKHSDVTLEEFKCLIREQFFTLLLDHDAALAVIPAMLPSDADARSGAIDAIREIALAAGKLTGERAKRLAQIEKLFGTVGQGSDKV